MAIDPRSEEEKRKKREAFELKRAGMGLGPNSQANNVLGANKTAPAMLGTSNLVQRAPKQVMPTAQTPSPQMAANLASQQRPERLQQSEIARQNETAAQKAEQVSALARARAVTQLPVAQQPKAVEAIRAQAVQPRNPVVTPVAAQAVITPNMVQQKPIAQPVTEQKQPVASPVEPAKSLLDDEASATNPVYSEGVTLGNPNNKKVGLSVDNNAAVAKPLAPAMGGANGGFGFTVMPPPRKAYGEDSRRAALAMDIKPYKNGMGLTTGQVALKNSILNGDDEKYANEQYTTQMNAAQGIAKAGMEQSGANSRAQLTERGATSRAELNERAAGERQANQLGFDSEKFRQTLALDGRKLDQQKSNDQITNYGVKKLNEFRESWFNAKTPEEKTAIEQQMAILNDGSKRTSKPIVINQTGQTATGDQMGTTVDNPAMLYDPDSKEFINLPTAERTPSDPPMLALQQNSKLSEKEKGEAYDTYMNGGDISSYLQ